MLTNKATSFMSPLLEPETLLEVKMTKLKLSYFRHVMRRWCFGKDNSAGGKEGNRKRVRPSVRWIEPIKEAVGTTLQELSRVAWDRSWWTSLIHRVGKR